MVRQAFLRLAHASAGAGSLQTSIHSRATVSYNSNNKWDQERAERERQEREADQRAKARYDARTNQLKAEYDARTAAGWGKTGAERNFRNDADYWKNQQKNINIENKRLQH